MVKDNQGWLHDLCETTFVGKVFAVRRVHCEVPCATITEVEFVKRICESLWSPPSSKNGWFAKRLKDLGRRVRDQSTRFDSPIRRDTIYGK